MATLSRESKAVQDALELLPIKGEIEFNEYKEALYGSNPDGGKEAFTHILKKGLVNQRLTSRSESDLPVIYLSRKG